jgi:hypothetical protein
MGFFYIRSESPYGEAVDRATTNSKVVETLGSPVDASFLFSGQIHRTKGQDSISELEIGLSGSKQDGTLYVKGVETGGVWGFSMLRVVARDGTTVNILNR